MMNGILHLLLSGHCQFQWLPSFGDKLEKKYIYTSIPSERRKPLNGIDIRTNNPKKWEI